MTSESAFRDGSRGYSIPSKYQTQVILNALDRKGFQSKSARFLQTWDDTPGPGAYTAPVNTFNVESPSYGQRGSGSFASRSRRMPVTRKKAGPTPSTYNVKRDLSERQGQSMLSNIEDVKNPFYSDFSSQNSSGFQKPIAVDKSKRHSRTRQPAPNQYNTTKVL